MPKSRACLPEIYLDAEVEKELTHRLSRIEGHVRGVRRMLAAHGACEDLLLQLAAIRAAVKKVEIRLLENHMQTCVADAVRSRKGAQALARLRGALAQVLKSQ
jgi:CsoR family transcriptional regulator, copper-sensing transcriptional repressor